MTDETAGADTPAADATPVADATVDTSEATTEQHSEAETSEASASETTGEEHGEDAAEKQKRNDRFSGRISELVRQRNEAERRAEVAERKLAQSNQTDTSDLEFEDQIARKTLNLSRQEQVDNERAAAQELAGQIYHERVRAAQERYPDFQKVAHSGWEPTPDMLELIIDSEMGPDIAYHFGKNQEEYYRIASLPPKLQAKEIGKIEARLSAPKPTPKQPPAPVAPVGANKSGTIADPTKLSMAEYIAARKAGKI